MPLNRRRFLTTTAATGAVLSTRRPVRAQQPGSPAAAPPSAAQRAAETQPPPEAADVQIIERPGSDFMIDVFQSLGFEYMFANPGSSFRSLHESLINYGGNRPEFITCMHEESAVAMCDGYARIEGKPALTMAHGTVGLQHAAMALYNAYCDQTPVYMVLGNVSDGAERRGRVEWLHAVQDAAAMVRDYTKWDDNPASLEHFAESAVRAYQIAMTPPRMPVVLVADCVLQEQALPPTLPRIPRLALAAPPAGDPAAVNRLARMLVEAESPVLVAGRAARTPLGLARLVELAETLQCAVIDQSRRMNFPSRHPLNQTLRTRPVIADADLIVGLEIYDFFGTVHQLTGYTRVIPRPLTKAGVKLASISAADLFSKSNYQNFQRYQELDLSIAADAEATLPALVEACKRWITPERRRAMEARGARLAEASRAARAQTLADAALAWDASPISTARLSAELWNQIRNEDWSLVSDAFWVSNWPLRLWDFTQHHQYIGGAGGEGVGYLAGATTGAALANRKYGRLTLSIQPDGDLMYNNGVLWTQAHHRIPILTLVHNNRAYHQEVMWLQRMAGQHNRGMQMDRIKIGTTIEDPNIDYAALARSMGVEAEGPIVDPAALGPAIARGIRAVKSGRPYLIDVVTQGR